MAAVEAVAVTVVGTAVATCGSEASTCTLIIAAALAAAPLAAARVIPTLQGHKHLLALVKHHPALAVLSRPAVCDSIDP